jgi:aarF domain-containing kinase
MSDIRQTLEDEFQQPIDDLFSSFDPEPIAAASIAQVHKAVLKGTGQEVCVKIQHPQLQGQVAGDMWAFQTVLNFAGTLFYDGFDFSFFAQELNQAIVKELDFVTEADNCERCGASFAARNDPDGPWRAGYLPVVVPFIYKDLSSRRVITMEYVASSVHANDVSGLSQLNISPKVVVASLAKALAEQIFVDGFVHCDPHPGNILLRRNASTKEAEIVLLDHGLYCTILPHHRVHYCRLWEALVGGDVPTIKAACLALGVGAGAHDSEALSVKQMECFLMSITQRPWSFDDGGFLSLESFALMSKDERRQLRNKYKAEINEIIPTLRAMPRFLLLTSRSQSYMYFLSRNIAKDEVSLFHIYSRTAARALAMDGSETQRSWSERAWFEVGLLKQSYFDWTVWAVANIFGNNSNTNGTQQAGGLVPSSPGRA